MAQTINDNDRFEWPVKVSNSNPHANVDFHYGPYDSYAKMADTESGVPSTVYFPGFTAAVLNEDGTVTEYQLEVKEGRDYKGADGTVIVDNLQWVMKGVPKKDYITFKGTAASEDDLKTKDAAVGDMYIISNSDNSYSEYVWTGEKWELLGTATAEMKGALSVTGGGNMVIKGSSISTSYNGSQNVVLDLSDLAKASDVKNTYQTKGDYATKSDLSNYATNSSLNNYLTKTDASSTYAKSADLNSLKERVTKLEGTVNSLRDALVGVLLLKTGTEISSTPSKTALKVYGSPVTVNSTTGTTTYTVHTSSINVDLNNGKLYAKEFYEE